MDIALIKKELLSVNGWRQNRDPQGEKVLDMLTSDSGMWYNDIHPMLTYDNLYSISSNGYDLEYPPFDPNKSDYAIGDIVTAQNKKYERIQEGGGFQNFNNTQFWKEYNEFTYWLKEKTEGVIGDVISDWKALRAVTMGVKNLLGNGKLFTNIMIGDDYVKSDSIVGHYIRVPYSKGLSTKINKLSTHFTQSETIELRLFKFGNLLPIQTISLNHDTPNNVKWHNVDITLDNDSKYYLVYDESALIGKPITSYYGGVWKMGKHITVSGFKANQGFNELWDIDYNSFTNETNFGLNFDFNVVCDPTEVIVEQSLLFAQCLYYRMGLNMLRDMAYNAKTRVNRNTKNMEWNKNEILFEIEGNPDGHRNGLRYEYDKMLKELNIDLSGMDGMCLGCGKRKVRSRVV